MGYAKEKASKFTHQYIIKNELVQDFLKRCEKVGFDEPISADYENKATLINNIKDKIKADIKWVITADGGYQEIEVSDKFPSYKLCYYNVGILTFKTQDLFGLEECQIINPDDLGRLKNLNPFSFVVPMKNVKLKNKDFVVSIREAIFEIFKNNELSNKDKDTSGSLLNTIKWLIFREYGDKNGEMKISCPNCKKEILTFKKQTDSYLDEKNDFIKCECGGLAYITDCFELHDLVDEISGAGAIASYIMSAFEMVLLLCVFRFFMESGNEKTLSEILFIKDGSLALFSRLDDFAFRVVRPFLQFLYEKSLRDGVSYANFVGLDKSGMFVEHLKNTETKIAKNSIILPNLAYIKRFITGDNGSVFGENTYFGVKMLVKKDENMSFVLDVAVPFGFDKDYKSYINNPKIDDFLTLKSILDILFKLKCDLYQNATPMAFVPIAMINKLISISNVPSRKILTLFSRDKIQ